MRDFSDVSPLGVPKRETLCPAFFNWKSALSILPPPFNTLLFAAHQNI